MAKFQDLTGKRFGRLTVMGRAKRKDRRGTAYWLCRCDCGRRRAVRGQNLRSGRTQSCGCRRKLMPRTRYDCLLKKRFGMLEVRALLGNGTQRDLWLCVCGCSGRRVFVRGDHLLSGQTRSCGCLRSEASAKRMWRHGATSNGMRREYRSWSEAKRRCFSPKHPYYGSYGGRGITLCERWRNSFEAFYADMGPAMPGQSLDRIDVNGNYEPRNCRWADAKTQAQNRRNSVRRECDKKMTLDELGQLIGAPYGVVRELYRMGLSLAQIVSAFGEAIAEDAGQTQTQDVEA